MKKRPNRKQVCVICDKTFKHVNHRKYCSEECYLNRPSAMPEAICLNCGKHFNARAYHGRQKFCCIKCYRESRKINKKRITIICERCGKSFEIYPSRIKFGNPRFCSQECAGNIRKWDNERFRRVKTPEWASIRKEILARDGRKCVICKTKKQLTIHHISPWAKSRDDLPRNLITLCRSCHYKVEWYGLPCPLPLPF